MKSLSRRFLLAGLALLSGACNVQALTLETVAEGLERPWAVAFLPDGRYLVTERPGRMRIVGADGRLGPPIAGVPEVDARGQGGLLDLVLDPDFARNRRLYFCYAEPGAEGSRTALATARLATDGSSLEEVKLLFGQQPRVASAVHFGCRIVLDSGVDLYLTLGERYRMQGAQALNEHLGKVIRLRRDGSVPRDNPFVGRPGAAPEIWSFGHRNPQGATWGPDGRLWIHEHGPQGGDEINLPMPGRNYGWPIVTHGENYGGGPIGEGLAAKPGIEPPLHQWTPSIAPSGMAFVTSARYGADAQGQLLVGSLKFAQLHRLSMAGGKVVREQIVRIGARVRDVREGPDGWIYLLTDERRGQLIRVKAF